jgi:hypothetical protein
MRTVRCALLCLLLPSSPGVTAKYLWEEEPASRWMRDFSHSARDNRVPLPTTPLEQEGIGEKIPVHDVFDRWVLNESVHVGRGSHLAEVTKDCKGKMNSISRSRLRSGRMAHDANDTTDRWTGS